jgi:hypothetical protein
VATANPGTNAAFVEQILTELARQSSQVSSRGNILEEIHSLVLTFPYGIESQSLARFASLLAADSSILLPIVQKILQEQASGKSTPQSIVNIAVQDASGGGKNVNDEIALAAQIIAKQSPGIPARNIESIIIQMALEISRAQGRAITGQTIFEIASQIKQNPNGILTQAILRLAKQDTQDNGKTGETVKVIKKVFQPTESTRRDSGSDKTLGAQLPGAQLPGAQLPGAQLPGAQLPGAQLPGAQQQRLPTIGDIWGEIGARVDPRLRTFVKGIVDSYFLGVAGPAGPQLAGGLSILIGEALTDYFALRAANNMEGPQALQALNEFRADVREDPNLLQRFSHIAQLYKTGSSGYANQALDQISGKLVSGIDPAVAIRETPIPGPEIPVEQIAQGTSEPKVTSLPPSTENVTTPLGDQIFPGIGVLAPQLDSPMPLSETAVPTEPVTDLGKPNGSDLSHFIPSQPVGLRIPAEIECLGNPELCTEPIVPSPSPPINICQEQWYLPECTQNGNELEADNGEDGSASQLQAPNYDESGYQQLPYYYEQEPGGYQEGEDQYSEDNSNEEDDYEGGYQEYEQDYSQEEDSGDEEDDYEEVGSYQEEEEQYTEEDNEEEEDFSEEEEESVEYYEE